MMEKAANMAGSALVLLSLFLNLVFFSSRNGGAASPPPLPDHSPRQPETLVLKTYH